MKRIDRCCVQTENPVRRSMRIFTIAIRVNRAFKTVVAANIMENEHSYAKMQSGIRPKIRCYRTGDVFVGIDLISGGFYVEATDMATAVPIYDDLFVFRGLDEDDLENFVLVAEYVKLIQK